MRQTCFVPREGCPFTLNHFCFLFPRLALPPQGPSAAEVAALPKWENRHATRGKSEGQVQVFQRDGKAIAAQWSMVSSIWIEVGEVRNNRPTKLREGRVWGCHIPVPDSAEVGGGYQSSPVGIVPDKYLTFVSMSI